MWEEVCDTYMEIPKDIEAMAEKFSSFCQESVEHQEKVEGARTLMEEFHQKSTENFTEHEKENAAERFNQRVLNFDAEDLGGDIIPQKQKSKSKGKARSSRSRVFINEDGGPDADDQ